MKLGGHEFDEVALVDFEFRATPGDRPQSICLVARELCSGRKHRVWLDGSDAPEIPPYPTGDGTLFIAYYASAELGCHLALGWPLPRHVLDLFVEFRNLANGKAITCGYGLLGALTYFGLPAMAVSEKDTMRALALRGGPWSASEQDSLLDYCESDVIALEKLLPKMEPYLDIHRAVHRGRFMRAAASIEHSGVPIDRPTLRRLQSRKEEVIDQLIDTIDRDFGIYDGRSFRQERFAGWLIFNDVPWPHLKSGQLALDDDTFREMARRYPLVQPLRQLRSVLAQLRLLEISVGRDSRNRTMLSAYQARTGRNQPSNSKFIFGASSWLRRLIKPARGMGLAYIDWEQQEFGIAASLSGDDTMIEAYLSGDPYLTFAQQAGAAPPGATKESHGPMREYFKQCALGVLYGMGVSALARQIDQPEAWARKLLALHRSTYREFWKWSDRVVDYAMLHSRIQTVFGWTLHITANSNSRSIRNFPMQANGAEMLRLACCLALERDIQVCAPVHDAILVEAPIDELENAIATTIAAMNEASEVVLDGFVLRTDTKITRYPERFEDGRGNEMWERIVGILDELDPPMNG